MTLIINGETIFIEANDEDEIQFTEEDLADIEAVDQFLATTEEN